MVTAVTSPCNAAAHGTGAANAPRARRGQNPGGRPVQGKKIKFALDKALRFVVKELRFTRMRFYPSLIVFSKTGIKHKGLSVSVRLRLHPAFCGNFARAKKTY